MTDKELKKLSRLELLELLLTETRENEMLREELEKIKKENSIEKSAQLLNETAKQLDEALQKVSLISNSSAEINGAVNKASTRGKFFLGKKPKVLGFFSKDMLKSSLKRFETNKRQKKSKTK